MKALQTPSVTHWESGQWNWLVQKQVRVREDWGKKMSTRDSVNNRSWNNIIIVNSTAIELYTGLRYYI